MKAGGNHSPQGQCPCRAGQPGLAAPRRHAGVRGASTSPASQLKIENLKTSNFHSAKNSHRRLGARSRGTPAPGQPRGPARDAGTRVVRGRWPRSGRRVTPAPGMARPRSPRGCCGTGHGAGTVWTEGAAPIATACFPSCGRPFAFSQLTSTLRLKIPRGGHMRVHSQGEMQREAGRGGCPIPSVSLSIQSVFEGCFIPHSTTPYPCSRRCRENNSPASTDYSCPHAVPAPVGAEPHPVFSCCFSDLSRLFLNDHPELCEAWVCSPPSPSSRAAAGLGGGGTETLVCALTPCWGQRRPPAMPQNGSREETESCASGVSAQRHENKVPASAAQNKRVPPLKGKELRKQEALGVTSQLLSRPSCSAQARSSQVLASTRCPCSFCRYRER